MAEAPSDLLVMGQVLMPYGVRGWVNVRTFTETADSLLQHGVWWLRQNGGPWRAYSLVEGKVHGGGVVAGLEGIGDRDLALRLAGAEVGVSRSELPEADEGEYYWADLIGVPVENLEGHRLGIVVGLLETGAHDVLRVAEQDAAGAAESAPERLIPFVAPILVRVELPDRIVVDWGLDY